MFNALFLHQTAEGIAPRIEQVNRAELPDGEVLVAGAYSSLNYKDGLAVTGKGKIIRGAFPFIPGIDLVGQVEASSHDDFNPGDWVIQTGGGLGETRWGGYAQLQRLSSEWVVALPEGLSSHEAMVIGTAGFTAMLSVMALEHQGLEPEHGEVVVTGASGGVGSMAVALLAQRGYAVVAATGSIDAHDYLLELGAKRTVGRATLSDGPRHPLESAQWAGAIDTVGGNTLASVVARLGRHGSVAVCGNAGGFKLNTTVYPFILRGVNLLGIDSNTATRAQRAQAWSELATLPKTIFERIHAATISLADIPTWSDRITEGGVRGRVVVDVNSEVRS